MNFSPYEYEMAMALATHPGLVAFDTTGTSFMSLVSDKHVLTSMWEQAPTTGQLAPRDDYDESTAIVDVFQVYLASEQERRTRRRPFKFPKEAAIRIVSTRVSGVMPSRNVIMVDAFPLTESIILDTVRAHLLRTEYAKENDEFLWGPVLTCIREE